MIDRTRWREELKARFSQKPVWHGPEHQEGWRDLVCDLVEALEKTGVPYVIVQAKQKLGALRFYVDASQDHPRYREFHQLIKQAESKSETLCELCGSPGELRGTHPVQTLCDACHEEKRQADRRFRDRLVP